MKIILLVVGLNALALLLVVWLIRLPRRVVLEVRDHRRRDERGEVAGPPPPLP
jgi:hypothetical protein